jgi:hypothetical protein
MTHKRRTEEYEISMDCPFKQRIRRRRPAGGTYSEGETWFGFSVATSLSYMGNLARLGRTPYTL